MRLGNEFLCTNDLRMNNSLGSSICFDDPVLAHELADDLREHCAIAVDVHTKDAGLDPMGLLQRGDKPAVADDTVRRLIFFRLMGPFSAVHECKRAWPRKKHTNDANTPEAPASREWSRDRRVWPVDRLEAPSSRKCSPATPSVEK